MTQTMNLLETLWFVDQRTGLPLLASEAVEGADVAGTAGNAAAGAGAAAEDIAEPPL